MISWWGGQTVVDKGIQMDIRHKDLFPFSNFNFFESRIFSYRFFSRQFSLSTDKLWEIIRQVTLDHSRYWLLLSPGKKQCDYSCQFMLVRTRTNKGVRFLASLASTSPIKHCTSLRSNVIRYQRTSWARQLVPESRTDQLWSSVTKIRGFWGFCSIYKGLKFKYSTVLDK